MDMRRYRAGQHLFFDIAADGDIVLSALTIGDASDVLLDDRTLVKVGGNVVRGSRRSASRPARRPACRGWHP